MNCQAIVIMTTKHLVFQDLSYIWYAGIPEVNNMHDYLSRVNFYKTRLAEATL